MILLYPEPKSFPQFFLQPWLCSQITSPFSFSFCRHSSCSVLLLNEAMFYQLRFPDLHILVAALSQSSHHQPLPVSPLPNNTQAFLLGQSSCSWGQYWSGTDLVEAKSKTYQNTYTKKKKNNILSILQGFLFTVLTTSSSWCGLLQSHMRSCLDTTGRGLSWSKTVWKKAEMGTSQDRITTKASLSLNHGQGF